MFLCLNCDRVAHDPDGGAEMCGRSGCGFKVGRFKVHDGLYRVAETSPPPARRRAWGDPPPVLLIIFGVILPISAFLHIVGQLLGWMPFSGPILALSLLYLVGWYIAGLFTR